MPYAVIFIALCCVIVQAQTPTGALAGTVTDQTGAVVSGATVVVKNEETGQEFNTTTTGNGTFNVPALNTGTYTVTVTAHGFKKAVAAQVKVAVGTPSCINVELEVGQVSDTVTVTAVGGDLLQTQTATVGQTITGRQITETPFTSRDALDLITLLPVGQPTMLRLPRPQTRADSLARILVNSATAPPIRILRPRTIQAVV